MAPTAMKCRTLKMEGLPSFFLYNETMKFYEIDIEYIKYLHSFDNEDYYDASNSKYLDKPYVGIIVYKDDIKYFIPLTSAKKKHLKLKK